MQSEKLPTTAAADAPIKPATAAQLAVALRKEREDAFDAALGEGRR